MFPFCVKYEIFMTISHVYTEGVGGEISKPMPFCHRLVDCSVSDITNGKQLCVAKAAGQSGCIGTNGYSLERV